MYYTNYIMENEGKKIIKFPRQANKEMELSNIDHIGEMSDAEMREAILKEIKRTIEIGFKVNDEQRTVEGVLKLVALLD